MLTARLSVYKMFVRLEVVTHRQLRYVVGEYLAPPVEQIDILIRIAILLIYTFGHDMVANIIAGKFHHRLVVVGGYVVNLTLLDVVTHLLSWLRASSLFMSDISPVSIFTRVPR